MLLSQAWPTNKEMSVCNLIYIIYPPFKQLWTVTLCLTQPMAELVTLLEQHLDGQPPTVVTQATTWWETVLAHVKL